MSAALPQVDLLRAPELGNTTFLVSDPESGEAVAIDPLRDVDQYLRRADGLGVRVTRSLETHVHNDFVSGSLALPAYGRPRAQPSRLPPPRRAGQGAGPLLRRRADGGRHRANRPLRTAPGDPSGPGSLQDAA